MQVEIIERKTIRHLIEVNDDWTEDARASQEAANKHIADSIDYVGFSNIKTNEVVSKHTLSIDGELLT